MEYTENNIDKNIKLKNDLLLRAAKGEKIERPPVWLMRQAGRILPQYKALRNKLSGFKELVETPELACEVTIQPIDELNVDAAIIFSDILVIPEAMGLPYEMIEKKGPNFPKTVDTDKDLANLRVAPKEAIDYTPAAIKLVKKELNGRVPLIGFAGAPWTIFAYMIEGGGSKTFSKARKKLYAAPEFSHKLMDMITQSTINYLQAQVAAGADVIQVFDSWAGMLTPQQYSVYALPYLHKICNAITEVPVTVFAKGAYFAIEDFVELNCETIGLDWNMDVKNAKKVLFNKTLQGNLDPCQLYASKDEIKKATQNMLKQFGGHRHIVNLGHGVYPDTPLDGVKCFVDTVLES